MVGPQPGGGNSLLNITAPAVVKASGGTLYTVAIVTAGSAGNLIFNDIQALAYNSATAYVVGNACTSAGTIYYCILATTGNAPPNATYWSTTPTTASQVLKIAYGSLVSPLSVQWTFLNGIIVSAVPTGSQLSVSFL